MSGLSSVPVLIEKEYMNEPGLFIRIADLVAMVYGVMLIGVGIWAFKGRVPTAIKTKYSSQVISMSQFPFAYQWRQAVCQEDLPIFERARVRQQVFYIVITGIVLLILIYAYLNAAAMLHLCQLRGAGL